MSRRSPIWMLNPDRLPWEGLPQIEWHGRFAVLRDDMIPGGSKVRFLHALIRPEDKELVFGGPFCGGAPVALAVVGKLLRKKVTLFFAKRRALHPRQRIAQAWDANLVEVPYGRMTVVQKRARDYAAKAGARFFPLGFDLPEAEETFVTFMRSLWSVLKHNGIREAWCATGSGMLARCLGRAYPELQIHAVAVGLASRHSKQSFPENVRLYQTDYRFEEACEEPAPFPCCPNYDRKAWLLASGTSGPQALFWNVMG